MAHIAERVVADLAEEHGVPADVARELTGLLRPCVLLVRQQDLPEDAGEPVLPAGRPGGLPASPEDVEWPDGAGPFALTVDCAALPASWLDIGLPPDGHLLLFTTFKYEPENAAVLHVPAGVPTAERGLPDDLDRYEADPTSWTRWCAAFEEIAVGNWKKMQHEQQCSPRICRTVVIGNEACSLLRRGCDSLFENAGHGILELLVELSGELVEPGHHVGSGTLG